MKKIMNRKTAEKRRKRGKRKMARWRTRRKKGWRKWISTARNRRKRMMERNGDERRRNCENVKCIFKERSEAAVIRIHRSLFLKVPDISFFCSTSETLWGPSELLIFIILKIHHVYSSFVNQASPKGTPAWIQTPLLSFTLVWHLMSFSFLFASSASEYLRDFWQRPPASTAICCFPSTCLPFASIHL